MSRVLDNGGVFWDYVQVRKNCLLFYSVYEGNRNPAPIVRRGAVDKQKINRFIRYFQILLTFSAVKTNRTKDGYRFTWRLNFLTITLPGKPTGNDNLESAFSLFRKKLVYAGFKNYLWRKEIQPGTGNVHWHIVGNTWIDYQHLNKIWNTSLKKHCPEMMKNFFLKHGHYKPPSTDVSAIRQIGKCISYAAKYLKKEGDPVPGNTFGISRNLLAINWPSVCLDDLSERPNCRPDFVTDFCTVTRTEYIELTEELKKIYGEFQEKAKRAINATY